VIVEKSKLDALLQAEFPTVMVSKFGDLPSCAVGKTRLLMAADGLYLETAQPFGRLVVKLWAAPRELPYGRVAEVDEFREVFDRSLPIILSKAYPAAICFADQEKEWCGHIYYREGELLFQQPDFSATIDSADYTIQRPAGAVLAVDIHSHGGISPFFSSDDNKDDKGGVRICVVLGNYDRAVGRFDSVIRYVVEGFFINFKEVEHAG
jgi:PRTRC genetic system protein A